MTSHIRTAIGEALTHLKKGDVLGATSLIKQTLGIGTNETPPQTGKAEADVIGPKARAAPFVGKAASSTPPSRGHRLIDAFMPDLPTLPTLPTSSTSSSKAAGDTGNFTSRTYYSNAGLVAYKLYIPKTNAPEGPALIMMLHGCTQNPDDFARGTGMNELADEFGFMVVYPSQPRTSNPQGCWNWFEERHQHRGSGEPVLLAGLAQELAREFKIDSKRIFAAGLSAGGAMADVLASTYPDVFAAVGIHSGLPAGAATNMMSALGAMKGVGVPEPKANAAPDPFVRKIIFHGDADTTVTASNGQAIFDRSQPRQLDAVEVANNSTVNGRRVTRTTVQKENGTSLAEHWVIHGSGHAWAGGHKGGSYVDPTGPEASREMVRFFLEA